MERTRVAFDVVRQAFDLAMAAIRPPWVQLPGRGAVGCTETIRVTSSGAEALTSGVTRALIVA